MELILQNPNPKSRLWIEEQWAEGDIFYAKLRLKPEPLIKFRQGYIGPAVRSYGNMLRAGDCPNDALCNKTAILDLRLTSGRTPVHSDMLMWHPRKPAELSALTVPCAGMVII